MSGENDRLRWERLAHVRDRNGESPLWDDRDGCVYWIDCQGQRVRQLNWGTRQIREWRAPSTIGCIGLATAGHLVVALRDGFYLMDLSDEKWSAVALLDPPLSGFRLNDGKVDRAGRFLAGSLFDGNVSSDGFLFRLGCRNMVEKLEKGVAIANALAFSPDGSRLYFGDTLSSDIFVYDYDSATGAICNKRLFINTRTAFGAMPDGATTDSDGNYWVTLVDKAQIACLSPKAELLRMIDTPMQYPSCVAFGGPQHDILFVTSISDPGVHAPPPERPETGYLYALHGLGITGMAEPICSISS